MRLSIIVIAVLLFGCRSETENQKCDRLRKAASVAMDAYLEKRQAEQNLMESDDREIAYQGEVMMRQERVLFAAREAIKCGYVEGLATRVQPTVFMVDVTADRMFPAIQASRDLLELEGPELVLPPETAAAVTRVIDAFEAASKPWSEVMTRLRPGQRWSASQRTYLTSLEAAWCELEHVLDDVIDPRIKITLRETKRLDDARDPGLEAASAYRMVTSQARQLRGDLVGDGPAVPVPKNVEADPAFAPTWPAIKAYNLCRN